MQEGAPPAPASRHQSTAHQLLAAARGAAYAGGGGDVDDVMDGGGHTPADAGGPLPAEQKRARLRALLWVGSVDEPPRRTPPRSSLHKRERQAQQTMKCPTWKSATKIVPLSYPR